MAKDKDNLCPLMVAGKMASPAPPGSSVKCRTVRCRWWNVKESECCVETIAKKGS